MAVTTKPAKRPLRIRIEGTSLPGRAFCEHQHVHVAVQCRSEPVDLVPGDAAEAIFEFDVDILPSDDGAWDFRGPFVHGKRSERFLYLTWGDYLALTDAKAGPRCASLRPPAITWSAEPHPDSLRNPRS